ncbi:MAG: FHA domain-containing protein [Myxococcaceae bacterium]
MAFTLTVSKGPGQGTDFEFDQAEARLGRTADNDIVVKDASASRSHCRVYVKNNKFFVEDLKSANGTKLNSKELSGAREIHSGDLITIGDVVFTFSTPLARSETLAQPPPSDTGDVEGEPEDPNATILKPQKEAPPPAKRGSAKMPVPRTDTEAEVGTVPRGKKLDVEKDDTRDKNGAEDVGSTREVEMQPPRALAKANANVALDETRDVPKRELARKGEERGLRKSEKAEETDSPLSAADRMRQRREAQKSTMGRVGLAFSDMSMPAKIFSVIVVGAFAAGTVAAAVYVAWPKPSGPPKIEPTELFANAPPVRDSFGAGDDVQWQRSDMKVFNFSVAAPTKVVVVLHYQAKDISKEEVSINANGTDLGFIPPDTIDVNGRELEVVLPPEVVKKNEVNNLIFDSLHNPPNSDPWRIWNVRLEQVPVPDLSPDETARAAREDIQRAEKAFENKDLGDDNLFRSWKSFRTAWLELESLGAANRPKELYDLARTRMREVRPLLDKQCNSLLVEYQKAMTVKPPQRRKAIAMLKDIERYFPTAEHPCNAFSKEMLQDMGEQ